MVGFKLELIGKKRTLFFELSVGNSSAQRTDVDELSGTEVCADERAVLPEIEVLKKVEDEWIEAGIIV